MPGGDGSTSSSSPELHEGLKIRKGRSDSMWVLCSQKERYKCIDKTDMKRFSLSSSRR